MGDLRKAFARAHSSAAGRPDFQAEAYRELRALAHAIGRGQRNITLGTTALVHEAWLRLVANPDAPDPSERLRFAGYVASVMRNLLVDHARAKNAKKRRSEAGPEPFDTISQLIVADAGADILAVHEGLRALANWDERSARLVELRFFGGLSEAEAAASLGISLATASRDWRVARAWLRRHLAVDEEPS